LAKLRAMVFVNPGGLTNVLGIPLVVVVLGFAILGFIVGALWLRRIFSVDDDSGDWWRFRR
jgi:hypothetical protein